MLEITPSWKEWDNKVNFKILNRFDLREREKKITKINTVLIGRKKEDGKRLEREIKWESEKVKEEREREREK